MPSKNQEKRTAEKEKATAPVHKTVLNLDVMKEMAQKQLKLRRDITGTLDSKRGDDIELP